MLRRLGSIRGRDIGLVGMLSLLTASLEGVSVALLLPMVEYIQYRDDPGALGNSRILKVLGEIYTAAGVPVTLATLSGMIFLVVLGRELINYAAALTSSRLVVSIEKNMRDKLVRDTMSARLLSTDKMGAGAFVELVYGQCRNAAMLFDQFIDLWKLVITVGAYAVLAVVAAPLASLAGLAAIILSALSINRFVAFVRRNSTTFVHEQKTFAGWIAERYRGRRVIKLGRAVQREAAAFGERSQALGQLQYRISRVQAQAQFMTVMLLMVLSLIGLIVAVDVVGLGLATVTVAILSITRVVPLAISFNRLRQVLANRIANLERVADVARQLSDDREHDPGVATCPPLSLGIELCDVTVSYPGSERPALEAVSVRIPAFAMTALIGRSGAGKSTLIDVIPRLIEPTAGQVLWDGRSVQSWSLDSLRSRIAFMPQQAVLFNDTVLNNVRYFRPEASRAEVEAACVAAYAHEFVERLPNGYDTYVGEGGGELSGGQQQRLALARALLLRADVIILDEPTSAIDPESEKQIQAALDRIVETKAATLIVIAHRISTVRKAGHVIVLNEGRVVSQDAAAVAAAEPDVLAALVASTD